MPDPSVLQEQIDSARRRVALVDTLAPSSRAAINDQLPRHDFVESEFEQGAGRCDKCGGGPGAEIHQQPVDHMAWVADALERIAGYLAELMELARKEDQ
jgi:hypothetical protein